MQQTVAKNQRGFILVDITLTILTLSILLTGGLYLHKHASERHHKLETEHKMTVLVKALSNYAQMRWRLPCPANPNPTSGTSFGEERRNASGTIECTSAANAHGIIPFRTLGVPEQYAKDGYGNFFTYVVSPVFTRDNTFKNSNEDKVHARLAHLIDPENFALIPKAQFCGALDIVEGTTFTNADDLLVQDPNSSLYLHTREDSNYVNNALTYANANGAPNANFSRDQNITTTAVALISHGANGYGAYLGNNSLSQKLFNATTAGNTEDVTTTPDNIVQIEADMNRSDSDTLHYDDIVLFLTQDQVFATGGGNSCEHL